MTGFDARETRSARAAYTVSRSILRPLTTVVWRPTVRGLEHVPLSGPLVIASNHLSFIDSFVIPLIAPRKVRFLAKAEYFNGSGPLGALRSAYFSGMGAIPVDRTSPRAAQQSLDDGLAVLRAGGAFGIYPEGTRSRDGRLYRGRTGVAFLSLTAHAPVVPVGLVGTDKVQPVDARLPQIAHVRIAFGAPIHPEQFAGMPQGKARRALTDAVMDAIAGLSGQERAGRYNTPPTGTSTDG